jgi:hypothetical protein
MKMELLSEAIFGTRLLLASAVHTYTKIGTIQRRLAWPLRKDDMQNRDYFTFNVRYYLNIKMDLKLQESGRRNDVGFFLDVTLLRVRVKISVPPANPKSFIC